MYKAFWPYASHKTESCSKLDLKSGSISTIVQSVHLSRLSIMGRKKVCLEPPKMNLLQLRFEGQERKSQGPWNIATESQDNRAGKLYPCANSIVCTLIILSMAQPAHRLARDILHRPTFPLLLLARLDHHLDESKQTPLHMENDVAFFPSNEHTLPIRIMIYSRFVNSTQRQSTSRAESPEPSPGRGGEERWSWRLR